MEAIMTQIPEVRAPSPATACPPTHQRVGDGSTIRFPHEFDTLIGYSDSVDNFSTMRFVEKMTKVLINY